MKIVIKKIAGVDGDCNAYSGHVMDGDKEVSKYTFIALKDASKKGINRKARKASGITNQLLPVEME